jgi:hypothetical protein
MKIAILEYSHEQKSATGVRGRAIKTYLQNQGHTVEVLAPSAQALQGFERRRYSLTSRLKRRLLRRKTLAHLWDFLADQLEPQIRRGQFDAVIGRGQEVAYALTRELPCVKILDMANILFLEFYYAWGANLNEVDETFDKEMQVFEAVDYILSPHDLLSQYFLKHFNKSNGNLAGKVVTVRLGCELANRQAHFDATPRIAYAGSYYYIQDPYLLAELTRMSPYGIDCYGPKDPNRKFFPAPLQYKGYAETTDFLADYQFGLITVSRDALRQYSPATKFPYYFAYGLPVLFPEWMKEGHAYPQCAIPFTEENFVEQVKMASDKSRWEAMSCAAAKLARELEWSKTLLPLGELLQKGRGVCR